MRREALLPLWWCLADGNDAFDIMGNRGRRTRRRESSTVMKARGGTGRSLLQKAAVVLAAGGLHAGVAARAAHAAGVTYALDPATAAPTSWAKDWTSRLAGTTGWTGGDGCIRSP